MRRVLFSIIAALSGIFAASAAEPLQFQPDGTFKIVQFTSLKRIYLSFFLLLCFTMFNAVDTRAQRSITEHMVEKGVYKLGFSDDAFGNDNTAWNLSFQFDEFGVIGRLLVASKEPIPTRDDNEIVITFNTRPVRTMTIACEPSVFGFDFALSSGIIKPIGFDYMNTPMNRIEFNNMAAFIAFKIASIKINGVLLPGPYPTSDDFLKLFDTGVGKFPTIPWYDKYRSERYGKSRDAASKSTTSKSTANNTTASKSTPSKSTTSKSSSTTQSKNLEDETLRSLLQMPLGFMSSDIYFSYPKASAKLKQMYGANCEAEYDKCGKIYVYDTNWLKVGGYATSNFSLWINNDHTEWSYTFPYQKTLSGAQNFCNSLASKIKALGIELINKPVESFPVYYKGNYEGMKIVLRASKSIDEYYITLNITHSKEVSKSDLNPVVTVAELFERPLGAPKGNNPVHWFVEKGFVGKVDADMRSVSDIYSAGSYNYLHIHIPLQGSAIYKGLNSSSYNLTMADRSPGHSGHDFYMIEFTGDLKDGIYSWNVKSKQEKQEMKYLWDQLIRELMMQGHKLVKANKKTSGFSDWNPQEGYLENDGKITRRYILTKKNRIVITEQKPYPMK